MTDYTALTKMLSQWTPLSTTTKKVTFDELNALIGELPPESAYRAWWNNDGISEQSKSWCSIGFKVIKVVPDTYILFEKDMTHGTTDNSQQNNTAVIENKRENTSLSGEKFSTKAATYIAYILTILLIVITVLYKLL